MEGRKKGKLKWIIIGILGLAVLGAAFGDKEENTAEKTGEVTTQQMEADSSGEERDDAVVEATTEAEEAKQTEFQVGDIVETKHLKISYFSAEPYASTNQFIQPKEGYEYYRMEFEFENIGDTDETISSMVSWNCYADGYAMDAVYIQDDSLGATLSPGKKTVGAVYYEVKADAQEIELEYEADMFSKEKIIFIVK